MKKFTFDIFKLTVTIIIGGKKYDKIAESKKEDKPAETVVVKETDISYGTHIESMTVRKVISEYIDLVRECGKLSASTIRGYENIRDKHLGYIMPMGVGMLEDSDIQHAFDLEIEKNYSVKTLKSYLSFLKKALKLYRPDLAYDICFEKEEPFDENA